MAYFTVRSFWNCLGLAALLVFTEAAAAETVSRIRDSGVIRIGHRADALPHSYGHLEQS